MNQESIENGSKCLDIVMLIVKVVEFFGSTMVACQDVYDVVPLSTTIPFQAQVVTLPLPHWMKAPDAVKVISRTAVDAPMLRRFISTEKAGLGWLLVESICWGDEVY